MTPAASDPIPAATLILMRPGLRAPTHVAAPEILMIERAAAMAFAPGALVFPGGRIDADDYGLGGDLQGAAKVAAIRETLEETGIAVALDPPPPEALEAELRRDLHAGAPLSALLGRYDLALRPDDLIPFARWCPTFRESRNFDAHFFIARAPVDSRLPIPDATETVHASWTTAADVLARADTGVGAAAAHIIFPTRRNLERLARFASFADAASDAGAHPVATIIPWIEERDGAEWLCIPEGGGYPVTAERLASAKRG